MTPCFYDQRITFSTSEISETSRPSLFTIFRIQSRDVFVSRQQEPTSESRPRPNSLSSPPVARQHRPTSASVFFSSDGKTLEFEPRWQHPTERDGDMPSQPPSAVVRSSRALFLLYRTKAQTVTKTGSNSRSSLFFNRSSSPFVVSSSGKQNSLIKVFQQNLQQEQIAVAHHWSVSLREDGSMLDSPHPNLSTKRMRENLALWMRGN